MIPPLPRQTGQRGSRADRPAESAQHRDQCADQISWHPPMAQDGSSISVPLFMQVCQPSDQALLAGRATSLGSTGSALATL